MMVTMVMATLVMTTAMTTRTRVPVVYLGHDPYHGSCAAYTWGMTRATPSYTWGIRTSVLAPYFAATGIWRHGEDPADKLWR